MVGRAADRTTSRRRGDPAGPGADRCRRGSARPRVPRRPTRPRALGLAGDGVRFTRPSRAGGRHAGHRQCGHATGHADCVRQCGGPAPGARGGAPAGSRDPAGARRDPGSQSFVSSSPRGWCSRLPARSSGSSSPDGWSAWRAGPRRCPSTAESWRMRRFSRWSPTLQRRVVACASGVQDRDASGRDEESLGACRTTAHLARWHRGGDFARVAAHGGVAVARRRARGHGRSRNARRTAARALHRRPIGTAYEGTRLDAVLREARREIEALPGVRSTALVNPAPFSGARMATTARSADAPDAPGVSTFLAQVSPELPDVTDLPVIRGRWFSDSRDDEIVVNQSLAIRLWPDSDPLGKHVTTRDFNRLFTRRRGSRARCAVRRAAAPA